jgi:hypothetical protein
MYTRLLRSPFAVAALFAGLALPALPQAQQPTTVITPHEACCGVITANGYRLTAVLDSMNVEKLWLNHRHINWETGEADRPADFTGSDTSSHCSSFAAAVGERLHIYMLRPPDHRQTFLASAQAEWFHTKGGENGWLPLAGQAHEQRAQQLANQGNLVVIVYESPDEHKPGHIAIVRPSLKSPDDLRIQGPEITQAGAENYQDSIAARSFVHHPGAWPDGVRYYYHPVDWATLPPAPAATSAVTH